jgi:hypothetical protein
VKHSRQYLQCTPHVSAFHRILNGNARLAQILPSYISQSYIPLYASLTRVNTSLSLIADGLYLHSYKNRKNVHPNTLPTAYSAKQRVVPHREHHCTYWHFTYTKYVVNKSKCSLQESTTNYLEMFGEKFTSSWFR